MSEQFLLGFAVYIALVFIPGLGFGEFLGLWKRFPSIAQRLALCFGLGIVVDTTVFVFRAYGPIIAGRQAGGIDVATIYFLLLLGIALLSTSIVRKRVFGFATRPKLNDLALFSVIAGLSVMLLLYFAKFPIFPEFQSGDYYTHVLYAERIANGSLPSVNGFLYYGVHFQLASALLLVGGEGLVTSRETLAILVALSPLLFYLAASALFDSETVGLIAATVYSFSATIWFVSVFDSGLYPNFFGILAVLLLIVSVKTLIDSPTSKVNWLFFVLSMITAYVSHYSTLSIIPALFLLPLIQFLRERRDVIRYLWPALIMSLPLVAAIAVRPRLFTGLIGLALKGGGTVSKTTYLSNVFSALPVLSYMASEVFDDVGLIVLFIFAAVSAYACLRLKRTIVLIPLLWFLSLLVAAPLNISSWRFSVEALIPLTLMASYGIFVLVSNLKRRISSHGRLFNTKLVIIAVILISPLVYGSWGHTVIVDSISNVAATSQVQKEVYSAIYWLKYNTPTNSTYLSLTDWRMTYTSLMIDRPTYYEYFSDQNQSVQYAKTVGAEFTIVTRQATIRLPPLPEYQPWYTFVNETGFTQVYANADVRVYQLS